MAPPPPGQENLLVSVLLELIIMIGAARANNALARRLGQPGVVGEIVAGLALGPSLFGNAFPQLAQIVFPAATVPALTVISQIGLLLLMFQIGTDFDFGLLTRGQHRATALRVATVSLAVPIACGIGFGFASARALAPQIDAPTYSLFCGVAVAITAVPILGRILREFGLTRMPLGVIAISAAAINDVVGWLLLAAISAYATSGLSGAFVLWRVTGLLGFAAMAWFALRPAATWLAKALPVRDGVMPPNLMATVLCLIIVLGLCTSRLGIFTIFGGFAGGLLFHRNTAFVEAWNRQVGQFVLVFFLPVFFTFTGLRTNLLGLTGKDLAWLALLLALSVLGKIVPVYGAARISGLGHWPSMLLGSLMNTRALMELIVLNIGYSLGFLPQKVFTMLVVMAVFTTALTGPLLQICLRRMGQETRAQVSA